VRKIGPGVDFSAKKIGLFFKNQCYDHFFQKLAVCSLSKKRQYFRQIFRRKYFLNHNIGPRSFFSGLTSWSSDGLILAPHWLLDWPDRDQPSMMRSKAHMFHEFRSSCGLAWKCPSKVPHQFAVGTAQVTSGTPGYWHSLTIVGYVGSFNVSLLQFPIASNLSMNV
jgi:hypothetical protein